ncbi:hypothetical protein N9B31_09955, partial [Mariniblastus sp.]|nr:hypothetical protein [Mariniblastus sp.]
MLVFQSTIIAIAMCFVIGSFSPDSIAADTRKVFVALTGDDSNNGSSTSPVQSIYRAQAIVRQMILDGLEDDVEIRFAEGVYQLNKTVEFGLEDSAPGKLQITYQAAPGARVVFSGGFQLSNWKKDRRGFWETSWREFSPRAVSEGRSSVPRQMFIDAKRGIRARDPDTGYFRVRQALGDFRT